MSPKEPEPKPRIVNGKLKNGVANPIEVDGGRVISLSLDEEEWKNLQKRAQVANISVEEQAALDLKDIINW